MANLSQKELEEWFMVIEDDDIETVTEKMKETPKLLGYYYENAVYDDEFSGLSSELLGNKVGALNPIQYACFVESEECALILADNMPSEKLSEKWGNGNTVLHLAAFNGMNRLVAKLIEKGVNPTSRNKQGYRPMDCVADELTREAFAQKEDGDTNEVQSPSKASPKSSKEDVKIRDKRKKEEEEKEEAEDGDDSYELVYPDDPPKRVINLNLKPKKPAIFSKKPKSHKVQFDEKTTFFDCIRNGEVEEVTEFITVKKYDPNMIYNTGITVLHLAVESGSLDVVKFLVEKGAKINAQDDDAWTPLHLASMYGYRDIIKYLLSKGASKDLKNSDGEKASDVAEDTDVQRFLKGQSNHLDDRPHSPISKKNSKFNEVNKETFKTNVKFLSRKDSTQF